MFKYIIFSFAVFLSLSLQAQDKKIHTIKLEVDGVCFMCKNRIENALDVNGIKEADWDKKTKICTVVYRPDKITEDKMHELLIAAGHDTKKLKAKDEVYNKLDPCCYYRTNETH